MQNRRQSCIEFQSPSKIQCYQTNQPIQSLGPVCIADCGTFEVEVLGTVDVLGDRLGVHFERVRVRGVSRDDHVVPLIVVERVVAVALQQTRPVAQVEHVVDEPV